MAINMPPIAINKQGEARRAGFELEYAGLPLEESARLVAEMFGGTIHPHHLNYFEVRSPAYGSFGIKLDMTLMQKLSQEAARQRQRGDEDTLEIIGERILSPIVATWMPFEIVTPPLPLAAVSRLDSLCDALVRHGAKGTEASPIYAFGLHINPELPDIPLGRLRDYLAAFVLLQHWLREETQMDITRQLSPYARLFPEEYCRLVVDPRYRPSIATLIDDYLAHNPTRNRALDMLPLFAWIDEPRVRASVDDARVRPRPAFHYRLPNCSLGKPDWKVEQEWNLWAEVERLAEDPPRLHAMSEAYIEWSDSMMGALLTPWPSIARHYIPAAR